MLAECLRCCGAFPRLSLRPLKAFWASQPCLLLQGLAAVLVPTTGSATAQCRSSSNQPPGIKGRKAGYRLQKLEADLNYSFKQKKLLASALSSDSYRQLAFLGDAAVHLLFVEHAFKTAITNNQNIRLWTPHIGTVVSRKHLAATAQHEWKLQHYISSSTPQSLVATGTNSSNGSSSVGVNRLGETFEAVIGAMIIDSNFAIVQATLLPWIAGSCCTMCDYTIQKLAWKTQAAAATSKKTTVNNSLEHQDASGELAKASAQPTAEPCRPSSEESALQGHKQPAATAARAPAASSCKSKYQNLMAASSDQKTQCRLKKQRQEIEPLLDILIKQSQAKTRKSAGVDSNNEMDTSVAYTSIAQSVQSHINCLEVQLESDNHHEGGPTPGQPVWPSHLCSAAKLTMAVVKQQLGMNRHILGGVDALYVAASSCSHLMLTKLAPELKSPCSTTQLQPAAWLQLGSSLLQYAAAMHSWQVNCSGGRHPVSACDLQLCTEKVINKYHRAHMLVHTGLGPSYLLAGSGSFFTLPWKQQASLMGQCLCLVLTAVHVAEGLPAALEVATTILKDTPATVREDVQHGCKLGLDGLDLS